MPEPDDLEEDYGPLDRMIGAGSHLHGPERDDLLCLTALELMRRGTAAGLPEMGTRVLRFVLLLWMQRLKASPYGWRQIRFQVGDLLGFEPDEAEQGLAELGEHFPIEQEAGWHGDLTLDLSPWFDEASHILVDDLNRHWLGRHVQAVQRACHGAELMIESYLDPELPQSRRPGATGRLTQLRDRWGRLKDRLHYSRPLQFEEAMENPGALHDEVAELEHLHDCVVALQADPVGPPLLFAELWTQEGAAKLQALNLPPALADPRANGPNLRLVGGTRLDGRGS